MVDICSKCKNGTLRENVSFEGALFWVKKVITIYCPACDYYTVRIFPSSLSEKQSYEMRRQI